MSDGRCPCCGAVEWCPAENAKADARERDPHPECTLERVRELEAAVALLQEQRLSHEKLLEWRGIEDACRQCGGAGTRVYGSTATWHGGAGGQTLTTDVCDWCWGSGDQQRRWPSRRSPAPPPAAESVTEQDSAVLRAMADIDIGVLEYIEKGWSASHQMWHPPALAELARRRAAAREGKL